ncbi:MAG: choice-of-anchor D domain-containing protein, partial [Verrucomicrobia bacterium]|nr:choice-of-anchor D domain-containing protein [Verrucomicrobiota bacterium]
MEPIITALADQASTVDFGSTLAAGRTFKVRNSGGVPLANLSATLTGADAASFTLIRQPSATVAAGNTTTFQVAFTGVNSGAKSATLEITSNDSDESPFQINLVGNRIARLEATFAGGSDIPLSAPSINLSGTEVQLTLNYVPALGTNLTVIKNTGTAFIAGQFSNLANGARVSLSHNGINYPFIAWYYGGAGNNDLVLLWPYTGLAAWGKNSDGQLGINTTQQSLVPVGVVQTGVLYGKTIVQVAHGNGHSLALCSDGSVAAWGANYQGQLGDNSTTRQLVPVAVNIANGISALYGKTVIAVAAGYTHSLALCSDGTVAAWGYNGTSTLGDNSTVRRLVPVAVNMASGTSALFGKTVVAVAAGRNHSLALCSDGTVTAWGYNEYGQLGDNTPTYSPVPVAVNVAAGTSALHDKTVVSIAAGDAHSLAFCTDGTVAGWGNNASGQLGDNSTTQRLAPVSVDVAGGRSALYGKTVSAVTAGASHSLALCSDGTMAAWGSNAFGQLGDGSRTQSLVPVAVNVESGTSSLAGRRVIDITAGHEHTLALCNDGTLSAWGYNYNGQLGDNRTTPSSVPITVNRASALAGKLVSRLAIGGANYHSLAVFSLAAPQIVVSGNDLEITNGDTTPSATDLTDFGCVALPHSQMNVFTIANKADNDLLNLMGTPLISLVGSGAAAFQLIRTPANAVAGGESTTFAINFDPKLPGLHAATVTIRSDAANHPSFSFRIRGFGALSTVLKQTIAFTPPTTVHLGQSPLNLSSYATSGLPVTLSVVPSGTSSAGATIAGNILSFTGTGAIKIQATQAGSGLYATAPVVVKTITARANPTTLTLLNLTQTYTGTPREISTFGGNGTVAAEYRIGTVFSSAPPTDAGTYSVRATDSVGPKMGTLFITKAPLYVTPDDKNKFVGQDNPPLTLGYSGWVNGETASLLSTALILKTTAAKASIGGVYP